MTASHTRHSNFTRSGNGPSVDNNNELKGAVCSVHGLLPQPPSRRQKGTAFTGGSVLRDAVISVLSPGVEQLLAFACCSLPEESLGFHACLSCGATEFDRWPEIWLNSLPSLIQGTAVPLKDWLYCQLSLLTCRVSFCLRPRT